VELWRPARLPGRNRELCPPRLQWKRGARGWRERYSAYRFAIIYAAQNLPGPRGLDTTSSIRPRAEAYNSPNNIVERTKPKEAIGAGRAASGGRDVARRTRVSPFGRILREDPGRHVDMFPSSKMEQPRAAGFSLPLPPTCILQHEY